MFRPSKNIRSAPGLHAMYRELKAWETNRADKKKRLTTEEKYAKQSPINQPIKRTNDQSINQSIKRTNKQTTNQSINQSIKRPINWSIRQPFNQSINQSIEGRGNGELNQPAINKRIIQSIPSNAIEKYSPLISSCKIKYAWTKKRCTALHRARTVDPTYIDHPFNFLRLARQTKIRLKFP